MEEGTAEEKKEERGAVELDAEFLAYMADIRARGINDLPAEYVRAHSRCAQVSKESQLEDNMICHNGALWIAHGRVRRHSLDVSFALLLQFYADERRRDRLHQAFSGTTEEAPVRVLHSAQSSSHSHTEHLFDCRAF
jgi:hypothetical protein